MTAIGVWAVTTERLSYVVTYGVSMNPVYYKGDLVVVARRSSYEIGDIAAYRDAKSGQRVLHRIIGGSASGFVFKGDNNQSVDVARPTAAQLVGKAALHVPHGGIWLKPLLSPSGLGMIVFLIAGGATAATVNRRLIPRGRRKKKVKAMSRQGGSWAQAAEVVRHFERMPSQVRVLAVVTAAAAGLALGLGLVGWTKPIAETVTALSGPAQTTTFSYSAKVPASPAYDGTTVSSPDPIFRRLTDRIDLRTRYEGPPGTFELSVELTNGTGWRTTIPLAPAAQFTGTAYQKTVRLDLKTLSDRADAAARATGVGIGNPLGIALSNRVVADGFAPFTATTKFEMNNVQMIVVSGSSLTASSDVTPATTLQPREIAVFGHEVMNAATARWLAILAFMAAMAGAVGVYFLNRRNEPMCTRAEIERRHPQLLVHVEPMSSPPGKPVVHVDNFPALVKLAERYGQMILTWHRPDADDFIVRDDGITYRYRIALDEPVLENVEHIKRPNGAGSHRRKTSSPVP